MRVLHFREAFSVLSETFVYDSYLQQLEDGLDAHLATVNRVHAAERPADNVHLLALNPKLHPFRVGAQLLGLAQRLPRLERPYPVYAAALRRAIQRLAPAVVHAHFGTAGVIAELALRGLQVPLVVTFYGHDVSHLPRERRWRARYRRLFARVAEVTVLSQEMRETVLRLGAPPERISVVHLARSLAGLVFRSRLAPIRRWIAVGRLVEKKGFDDAIRAVARLRSRGEAVSLAIVGEGGLRAELERLVKDLGVTDCVSLLGARNNPEVLGLLDAADAVLVCSKTAAIGDREGTPTVLIEAQALGLPCVATRHAGIPEMLPAENHWLLADEADVEGIADRMLALTRSSQEARWALGAAGRAHVEREFSLTEQSRAFRALYERAANSTKVGGR